jgi:hypothetical protein
MYLLTDKGTTQNQEIGKETDMLLGIMKYRKIYKQFCMGLI